MCIDQRALRRLVRASLQIRNKEREQRGPENALIATTMLSALQVAIYMVLSAFVLLGRWCSAETHVGLWFGVIIALAFSLVFGFLPAALMLWGFLDEARLRAFRFHTCLHSMFRLVSSASRPICDCNPDCLGLYLAAMLCQSAHGHLCVL